MNPQKAFFRKEVSTYLHTWRLWLMVVPVLLLAISSPLLVHFAPDIFSTTLDPGVGGGSVSRDADWINSYRQWTNSLKQFVPLLLIVIAIASVSEEISSGTIIPVLTGGLSRRDFILIKFAVNVIFAITVVASGTLVMYGTSRILFPDIQFRWAIVIIILASLLMAALIALAVCISILIPDVLSSVGLEVIIFILVAAATVWHPARTYTPVGLLSGLSEITAGNTASILGPVLSAIAFTVVLVTMAVKLFQRRDL